MEPIEAVFDALGKLTFAEMLELAGYLRDTHERSCGDLADAGEWAGALAFAAFVGWLTEGEDTTDCAPHLAAIDEKGE